MLGVRGSAGGWDTVLQAERSRLGFPLGSLLFFTDFIFPATLWPWSRLSLRHIRVSRIFPGEYRRLKSMTDNQAIFILRASISWSPRGQSRSFYSCDIKVDAECLLVFLCKRHSKHELYRRSFSANRRKGRASRSSRRTLSYDQKKFVLSNNEDKIFWTQKILQHVHTHPILLQIFENHSGSR
jgi:hypothetical protein